MSFSITVYRKVDRELVENPPSDVYSAEFDAWEAEANRRCLFHDSLGDGGTIHDLWSQTAKDLGLNLLSRLHDEGLVVQDEALDQLAREMQKLQLHWLTTVDPKRMTTEIMVSYGFEMEVPFLHELLDRAETVQDAVMIARLADGYLIMG